MTTENNKKQQKTKSALVVEMLREAILSGTLGPGDRLNLESLAARFGVSMTPVREAIQQLVAEGMLDQNPYKGVQVAGVSPEEVREIYLMRGAVEALAVRIALPNLKISEVQRLRTLHAQIAAETSALPGLADIGLIRKLNYEFHFIFYQAAAMPRLVRLIQNLWAQSPWDTLYVIPNRTQRVVDEHQRIVDAVGAGDAGAAAEAMAAHLEGGLEMLLTYLAERGSAASRL
jgi:DNA-binding GntR family transcriptional regulator